MITQNLNSKTRYEQIRDAVVGILATEIPNQLEIAKTEPDPDYEAILKTFFVTPDTTPKLNLYRERFIRYNENELNAINVYFDNTLYGVQDRDWETKNVFKIAS